MIGDTGSCRSVRPRAPASAWVLQPTIDWPHERLAHQHEAGRPDRQAPVRHAGPVKSTAPISTAVSVSSTLAPNTSPSRRRCVASPFGRSRPSEERVSAQRIRRIRAAGQAIVTTAVTAVARYDASRAVARCHRLSEASLEHGRRAAMRRAPTIVHRDNAGARRRNAACGLRSSSAASAATLMASRAPAPWRQTSRSADPA